jgi:hypothetical protein
MKASTRDAAFDAAIAEARALPIEAGLLGRSIAWKRGGRGREKCGLCPCGLTEDDGFAINTRKNVFICRPSGAKGDVVALAMHVEDCDFVTAVELLTGVKRPSRQDGRRAASGASRTAKSERQASSCPSNGSGHPRASGTSDRAVSDGDREAARNLATAARIASEMVPLWDTFGESYLREIRGIDTAAIADVLQRTFAIGWHPKVFFRESGHPLDGQYLWAIIGVMTDPVTALPTGAISRTYLNPADGRKIGKAKTFGVPAGIVRLSPDEDVTSSLFLAEGLETALTAMALGFTPTWSTGSTSPMQSFPVLPGIECLTIFADHDPNGAGERAAEEVIARYRVAGREARMLRTKAVGDLNDAAKTEAARPEIVKEAQPRRAVSDAVRRLAAHSLSMHRIRTIRNGF